MNRDDYNKLIQETETDFSKNELVRCAEGLTLLAKLGGESMATDHEVMYAGGPEIEDLSEQDAKTLCELGWNDYDNDMGFTFHT
jgi:hypothetical protein